MKARLLVLIAGICACSTMTQAQQADRDGLKVSGYIQLYYQHGEQSASLIGEKREPTAEDFSRLGVRRGRAKLSYTQGLVTGVLQIDLTERGLGVKDAYVRMGVPILGQSFLQAGLFDRPFGHEIGYSSSRRESPERALITRTLFPNERDLGAMLSLQASKNSWWHLFRLDAGLFGGNGVKAEQDSHLDFIGRLSAEIIKGRSFQWHAGTSLYYGGVYQGSPDRYTMQAGRFVLESKPEHIGRYARRSYAGLDTQMGWLSPLGWTRLRGEWIVGEQPASQKDSKSPNGALQTSPTYVRPLQGGYALLTQQIMQTPILLFVKYDWYDPNTALDGGAIGLNHSGVADISYQTLGIGAQYSFGKSLRATAYWEQTWNETTPNLSSHTRDLKDNRLTLALLYRF
ncbi:MAG: hypothetical protein Q4A64_08445 [Porphyromonadaceae bacterium]|nr:hypothetical protein [Porphyromonadaceae bacterium]